MNDYELQIKKQIDEKLKSCTTHGKAEDVLAIIRKAEQSKTKANLLDMYITDASFQNFEMNGMLFDGCVFEKVNFEMLELKDIQMVRCVFIDCIFKSCVGLVSFEQSLFSNVKLFGCRFSGANFIRVTFWKFVLSNSNVKNSNFSLSNYNDIKIENSEYQNTLLELKTTDIEKLQEINFNAKYHILTAAASLLNFGTKLDQDSSLQKEVDKINKYVNKLREEIEVNEYIQISQAELDEILDEHDRTVEQPVKKDGSIYLDMRGYDFSGMNMQEHNLTGIDFSNSNFSHAILAGCTCYDCDFTNCDLTESILYDIRLMRNDFSGAILKNIVIDKKNRKILIDAGILTQNQAEQENAYNDLEDDVYENKQTRKGEWVE